MPPSVLVELLTRLNVASAGSIVLPEDIKNVPVAKSHPVATTTPSLSAVAIKLGNVKYAVVNDPVGTFAKTQGFEAN